MIIIMENNWCMSIGVCVCVCIVCTSMLVVCMTILMDKTNCTSHERMAREKWLVSCCLCLVWFVHAFSLVVFLLYVRRSAAVFVAAASSGVRWWCLLLMNWTEESGVRYGSYCCIFNLFFFLLPLSCIVAVGFLNGKEEKVKNFWDKCDSIDVTCRGDKVYKKVKKTQSGCNHHFIIEIVVVVVFFWYEKKSVHKYVQIIAEHRIIIKTHTNRQT